MDTGVKDVSTQEGRVDAIVKTPPKSEHPCCEGGSGSSNRLPVQSDQVSLKEANNHHHCCCWVKISEMFPTVQKLLELQSKLNLSQRIPSPTTTLSESQACFSGGYLHTDSRWWKILLFTNFWLYGDLKHTSMYDTNVTVFDKIYSTFMSRLSQNIVILTRLWSRHRTKNINMLQQWPRNRACNFQGNISTCWVNFATMCR